MTSKSNRIRFFVLILALGLGEYAGATFAQSSDVVWTEETPLNTGEVINVDRKVVYQFKSTPGNPLQRSWQPTTSVTTFSRNGTQYSYPGSVMTIAVSPSNDVYLIRAQDQEDVSGWEPKCRRPSYVTFVMRAGNWITPERIEPWMVGLPRNQVLNVAFEGTPFRMTSAFRAAANSRSMYLRRTSGENVVEADYVSPSCFGKV